MKLGLIASAVLGLAGLLAAQTLTGKVVDGAGAGVANAKIKFQVNSAQGVSGADGSFSIAISSTEGRTIAPQFHTISGSKLNLSTEASDVNLSVYDFAGRQVLSMNKQNVKTLNLDFSSVKEGVYFMSLKIAGKTYPAQRIAVGKKGVFGEVKIAAKDTKVLAKAAAVVDSLVVDAATFAIKTVAVEDYGANLGNIVLGAYTPIYLHDIGFVPTAVWCGDGDCNVTLDTNSTAGCPAGYIGTCFSIDWPAVDAKGWTGGGWTLNGAFPVTPTAVEPNATKIKLKLAGAVDGSAIVIGSDLGVKETYALTTAWQEFTIDITGLGAYSPMEQPLWWVYEAPAKVFVAEVRLTR